MNLFKHYRESVIVKDTLTCKHIIVGDGTYYAGYYHGKKFEECVLYLDAIDNKTAKEKIDQLIIGKFCSIASGVQFMMGGTQGHNYSFIANHPLIAIAGADLPGMRLKGNTSIGNDVWLGFDSLIMPGVNIADGAVIAAKSVVTKNIGAYEIWGGNPAKLIKKRFTDDEIEKLLAIKWWAWDLETLTRNISLLRSNQVNALWQRFSESNL